MKKIAFAAILFAALFATASCQKEQNGHKRNTSDPMVINAVAEGIGTPTKTEMAYKYDVLWSEKDKILVTDGNSADTFTLSAGAGTTKGTFSQDGTASFAGEVEAFYPASMVDGSSLIWPATQTNDQTVPMYSRKTVTGPTEDFSFSSLGAVLQLVITTGEADKALSRIEVCDAEKSLSGTLRYPMAKPSSHRRKRTASPSIPTRQLSASPQNISTLRFLPESTTISR